MKLAWYAEAHGDQRARATRSAEFLAGGVTASGAVRTSCDAVLPEVVYHADAVGMPFHAVSRLGWANHQALADRNACPRYLAMRLHHLAERARAPAA